MAFGLLLTSARTSVLVIVIATPVAGASGRQPSLPQAPRGGRRRCPIAWDDRHPVAGGALPGPRDPALDARPGPVRRNRRPRLPCSRPTGSKAGGSPKPFAIVSGSVGHGVALRGARIRHEYVGAGGSVVFLLGDRERGRALRRPRDPRGEADLRVGLSQARAVRLDAVPPGLASGWPSVAASNALRPSDEVALGGPDEACHDTVCFDLLADPRRGGLSLSAA